MDELHHLKKTVFEIDLYVTSGELAKEAIQEYSLHHFEKYH